MDGDLPAQIEVHTSFIPLAFLLYFFKTLVVVDGVDQGPLPWGSHRFTVVPGRHHVRASVRYLAFTQSMANETYVDVQPGEIVQVRYRSPWLVFLKGRIRVVPLGAAQGTAPVTVGPASASPAAWHPDPARRHELRYWDGTRWTEHVSDQGVTSVDAAP